MKNIIYASFQYWTKGGLLLVPIALVCFFIWFYFLRIYYRYRIAFKAPAWLEDNIQERLACGESWDQITEFISQLNSFFCRIIRYVADKTDKGLQLSEIFEEIREKEIFSFEKDLFLLGALVTSAPLLGLLGTVWGMVETFQVIAMEAFYSSKLIADGISKALITTQFGLIVALPGIFGITVLKRKMRQLQVRFSILELHLTLGLRRRDK